MTRTTAPQLHHSTGSAAPPRERWVDACRALALSVVVLGHILISVIHRDTAGDLAVSSLLDVASWTHPITWVLQVMAVFFAVGGYAAAGSVRSRGFGDRQAWAAWTTRRTTGLLVPALPLLALWLLVGPLLGGLVPGAEGTALAGVASSAALVPLWFLATYVVVQALVPLWVRVADAGRGPVVLVALLGGVALVDAAHLAGAPAVGYVNFLLVWSLPTLLGVLVQSGTARPPLPAMAVAAVTGAVALVHLAGYTAPVVGVTGAARSNNSPPSLLLALHGLAYAATVLHLAPRLEERLAAARPRRLLDLLAAWSMPLYLWHMTALVVLGALLVRPAVGPLVVLDPLATTEPLSAAWWLLRPVVVLVVLALTLVLVLITSGATRLLLHRVHPADRGPRATAGGVLAAAAGVGMIVTAGTVVTPWPAVGVLALGLSAVVTTGRRAAVQP